MTFAKILPTLALFTLFSGIAAAQETGTAVFYSDYFVGKPTANGDVYSHSELTAAHNGYPYGTELKVTNLDNDKSVVVRVNDRMRSDSKVLIDLSRLAAEQLDFISNGKTRVRIEPVSGRSAARRSSSAPAPRAKPSPVR